TMCPLGSTVATDALPLDQTKLMFVISAESPVPSTCQARAVASASFPRIRIGSGVTLTCTSASCPAGQTQAATAAAAPGARRRALGWHVQHQHAGAPDVAQRLVAGPQQLLGGRLAEGVGRRLRPQRRHTIELGVA